MFREVKGPTFRDIFSRIAHAEAAPEGPARGGSPILVGSGKAAISAILSYLSKIKVLESRDEPILMSRWVGYWVYNTVHRWSRPVFSLNEKPKIVIPYHQYGFPQRMDLIADYAKSVGAVIIEDHAHSIWLDPFYRSPDIVESYKILSYSKFFFCYSLGAILGGDEDFQNYISGEIKNSSTIVSLFNSTVKLVGECAQDEKIPSTHLLRNLVSMSYSLYPVDLKPNMRAVRLMRAKISNEISLRRKRYSEFKSCVRGVELDRYLNEEDLAPYVIPLSMPENRLQRVLVALRSAGYRTGIYNFDTNRNLLNPKYEKVVWVLLHSGLSDGQYCRQIDIINSNT